MLGPGTYRFTVNAGSRDLLDTRIRLSIDRNGRRRLRHDRLEDVCPTAAQPTLAAAADLVTPRAGHGSAPPGRAAGSRASAPRPYLTHANRGFLPPLVRSLARMSPLARAAFLALLASAIAILAAALAPDHVAARIRGGSVLLHHRATLTLAGLGFLAAGAALLVAA